MHLRESRKKQKKKKAFTIIELVVVMCIVGILASALIPQVGGYITEAKKMKVVDQSRSVVMAVDSYNLKNINQVADTVEIRTIKSNAGLNKYLNYDDVIKNLPEDITVKQCRDIVKGGEFTIDENEQLEKVTAVIQPDNLEIE
ncbi:type II secretion system protein [Clostridium butyricum]|jgi:type IV pilus assembly protein PilA|uniref:Type II secretion system protein n=2 Tax=root TaxID=1 RepID=A0A512TSY2_CLOBU|nr:type II secretion system protein [Clostridium butyricum]ETI91581.1 MAG: Prokaryotic N-methylation motif protein [Clostridium butyricum DORA_1]MDK2827725.1 type pilus assembly protein PilA [Clostridium butyricum]MDU1005675.1 type II secretion system protein [Clostridium butyricum]MDU1507338.1 type II secretion system protein [Clostridium butyricum]MDU4801016.1 type II secretion system protein [Clostridium butyricum]